MRIILKHRHKQALIWVALVAVLVGGLWLGWRYWWQGGSYVPDEFTEARQRGAFVAEKIVFFGHQSLAGLEQISGLDDLGKYDKALKQVELELERNRQARDEALLLSSYLGTMAAYLSEIKPARAQAIATEAIGHEVNLVNHLIGFHGLLTSLFELLESKFRGHIKNSDKEVRQIISDINNEIKEINNLNLKFNELMEEFDTYYDSLDSVDKAEVDTN